MSEVWAHAERYLLLDVLMYLLFLIISVISTLDIATCKREILISQVFSHDIILLQR